MKRTTRNAAKTRQEIIEKSAPIFNVHGYSGTKMQMLIEATGYQMGGIYRHFDTKMDLAKSVFQYNYEAIIQPNLQFGEELNPKEKLLTIIENYKRMLLNPLVRGGCPLLNTGTEVDDTNESFRQLAQSFVEEILITLESILEDGKAANLFQPSLDVKKEALYLFATVEGAILIGKLTKKAKPVFDIYSQVTKYLEESIFIQ